MGSATGSAGGTVGAATGGAGGSADPSSGVLLEAEVAPGIVRLTLNRPAQRNALDSALLDALAAALRRHSAAPATRVLQLAASGTAFCAGADLRAMLASGREADDANRRDAERLAGVLLALRECPKPSVALVQGPAFGGGLGLVAACDTAVAGADARFRLPEVQLGLVPAMISPYVLEALGPRQARRWFLSGETFDALQAAALGLVHEAVPQAALESRGLELALAIAQGGPEALAACKALIAAGAHAGPDAARAASTAALLARLRAGAEAQEGIAAALERRPPRWRG